MQAQAGAKAPAPAIYLLVGVMVSICCKNLLRHPLL